MAENDRTPIIPLDSVRPIGKKTFDKWTIFLAVFFAVALVVTIISFILASQIIAHSNAHDVAKSPSGWYARAAVAADDSECSSIGREILENKNGSVADSAIATLLCLGIKNAHSCGIGGGSFAVIYDRSNSSATKTVYALDFREMAPSAIRPEMRAEMATKRALSIGIPGEIAGYYALHQRFGRLPWSDLFQPAINLARNGVKINKALAHAIDTTLDKISLDLRKIFLDENKNPLKEGDIMKRQKLADTLEKIAQHGPDIIYNGELAAVIAGEIQDGIMTTNDLSSYKPIWRDPVSVKFTNGSTIYTMPPPSSGPAYLFLIKLYSNYGGSKLNTSITEATSLAYHRFLEALKFGYGQRALLGDPAFAYLNEDVQRMMSDEFVATIKSMITDNSTHPTSYYQSHSEQQDGGTSHLSIMAPDGSAIAVTSTINGYFGSGIYGNTTGIVYNNELEDFALNQTSSSRNVLAPLKRPLSSMVPTLLIDVKDKAELSIGGSGGIAIFEAVPQVIFHHKLFELDLAKAIDKPRLINTLSPNVVVHEDGFPKDVLEQLMERGHKFLPEQGPPNWTGTSPLAAMSVVQGISRQCAKESEKCIEAACDYRKAGAPDGF